MYIVYMQCFLIIVIMAEAPNDVSDAETGFKLHLDLSWS